MSVERDRAGCVSLLRNPSRFWVSITKRMSWSPTRCESRFNFPSKKEMHVQSFIINSALFRNIQRTKNLFHSLSFLLDKNLRTVCLKDKTKTNSNHIADSSEGFSSTVKGTKTNLLLDALQLPILLQPLRYQSHRLYSIFWNSIVSLVFITILFILSFTMASNTILSALAHIASCNPCAGSLGRWKSNLQDDDADLWNDLTLINSIPDVKPPDIPKVVEVVSCSDGSDEDVSTLAYGSYHHHHHHHASPQRGNNSLLENTERREEEKSFTPSPQRNSLQEYSHRDPELEQVLEEIGDDDDSGDGDSELESIMGPRSQTSMTRSHIGRSIKRASSAPVSSRPVSLKQKQHQYQCPSLERHYSDSLSAAKENVEQECRDNFDATVPLNLGRLEIDHDGSSYSSVNLKLSFFKRNRISLFRNSSGSNYKALEPHSSSSTEDITVSTSTSKSKSRTHTRLKFKPFH